MAFQLDKKNALAKLDKSKKGDMDELVKPLCDLISSLGSYYTTSSCSGRIVLMRQPESGKKCDASWLFVTHKISSFNDVKAALKKIPEETVWFRFEPLIMHIACKDIKSASDLLKIIRDLGFKRSGIISTEKTVIELIGTERIDAPVAEKRELIVTEEYLDRLVNDANKKLVKNEEDIDRLFKAFLRLKN